jgi:RimJ/RimL family protein N-acetyltransferase
LKSSRLEFVAASIALLDAELDAPEQLAALLGARMPEHWPPGEWDRDAMEFFRDRLREGGDAAAGWYGWYALRRAAGGSPATLVGSGGYFGPPAVDGTVEIGYSVVPEARGQGIATEMIGALADRALGTDGVRRVIAHVRPDNEPSQRALTRAGFARTGGARPTGEECWERHGDGQPQEGG